MTELRASTSRVNAHVNTHRAHQGKSSKFKDSLAQTEVSVCNDRQTAAD